MTLMLVVAESVNGTVTGVQLPSIRKIKKIFSQKMKKYGEDKYFLSNKVVDSNKKYLIFSR